MGSSKNSWSWSSAKHAQWYPTEFRLKTTYAGTNNRKEDWYYHLSNVFLFMLCFFIYEKITVSSSTRIVTCTFSIIIWRMMNIFTPCRINCWRSVPRTIYGLCGTKNIPLSLLCLEFCSTSSPSNFISDGSSELTFDFWSCIEPLTWYMMSPLPLVQSPARARKSEVFPLPLGPIT